MRSTFSNVMISVTLTGLLILNGNMWWDYPPKSVNFGFRPLCGFDGDSLLLQKKIPLQINRLHVVTRHRSLWIKRAKKQTFHFHGPFSY